MVTIVETLLWLNVSFSLNANSMELLRQLKLFELIEIFVSYWIYDAVKPTKVTPKKTCKLDFCTDEQINFRNFWIHMLEGGIKNILTHGENSGS